MAFHDLRAAGPPPRMSAQAAPHAEFPPDDAPARARDADLLARLAAGDVDGCFALLVPRYETRVWRLCVTLLRDEAAAQDAAQDALMRVWQALPRFDPARAALGTWVYAITRNRCLSLIEQRRAGEVSLQDEAVQQQVEALPQAEPAVAEDARARLRALVDALPEPRRQCVRLYYYGEQGLAEVAAQLGCPEGSVKTHLYRARAALLQQLQAAGLADPGLWL